MKVPTVNTLDFETEAIQQRPAYPPKPVGFSLQRPGERRSRYWAWGHPTGNNCTKAQAAEVLRDVWRSGQPVLCQHGKFDLDVAETHFRLSRLPWEQCHDTEYLLFLQDPHAHSLSLKPSAQRLLNMPPVEQEVLKDWVLANVPMARQRKSEWGAYISLAPGDLVGEYADGDVLRTIKLFQFLYPEISNRNMLAAYNRERQLQPILLDAEREGIRVDLPRLRNDCKLYAKALEKADRWLRVELKSPDLNLDADRDVGEALARVGVVTDWVWTAGGNGRAPQRSISKKNLTLNKFHDARIASVYGYRVRLATCLNMFMGNWLAMAEESGGWIYTNWNQVRQMHGENKVGTRTGRLSSNPNFQNIPRNFESNDDGYVHPTFLRVPHLPLMRQYFLPDEGDVWIHRDFNQQELRVLAHFEDGPLLRRYISNPRFDIHTTMQNSLHEILGILLTRPSVKILNFSDVYGKGLANLAEGMRIDLDVARKIRAAKNQLMPGVDALSRAIKQRGALGKPIHTWGGREYYPEKSAYSKKFGRWMDFYYKLLNYLIQGSSADITKEAIIRYSGHPKRRARFLLSVHDELNSSSPEKRFKEEMAILREVMETIELDVPLLSDGKTGPDWGHLTKIEEEENLYAASAAAAH